MLDKKIEAVLNRQINNEMAAAYHYLAMAACCERMNLNGFAAWLMNQRSEELSHAMRLYRYILDRGGRVDLDAVAKPTADYSSVKELFIQAGAMEQKNTTTIYELYKLATEMGDYATQSHLQWFLDEQVEEEKSFNEVTALLELAGDDPSALLMVDDKLGKRASSG